MNDLGVIMQMTESLILTMQSVKDVSFISDIVIIMALLVVYLVSYSWQKKQIGRLDKEIGALQATLEAVKSHHL